VDDFALATAREIEISRENIAGVGTTLARIAIVVCPARIVTIAVVLSFMDVTPVIVPVAPFVMMILDANGTGTTAERERVITIALALVSVSGRVRRRNHEGPSRTSPSSSASVRPTLFRG
jgi:hypothetical protein